MQRLRELTVGEYEILAELGHGGMAAVYLAWHNALHKHVALKVMSPAVMLTEGMIERFGAEARTQARLEHPHIATVHGVRQDADLHYIVMQYVPGRTLSEVLRAENAAGRRLPLPVIRSLLFQIGTALSHAHREGVIHRDVKPGNVLLRANGDAVVTDFGIAKVLSSPSQTMTGTVVGTAAYMSPEQCYAGELTGASDQYSLGVIAYELLTGTTPFTGNSFAVMQAHVSDTPPPVSARRPDCPAEVEAAVMQMLAKKPDDRFADITFALEAIGAASAPTTANDPVRRELVRLADAEGVRAGLGDVLRAPLSPTPEGARPAPPRVPTPTPHTPVSGGRSPVPTTGAIASIQATAERSELQEGEVLGLVVQMLDRRGNAVADRPVAWRSSHPDIATVDEQGFVTAHSPGQAVLTATCEGKTATIAVIVARPPVASLEIIAPKDKLRRGERLKLTTRARSAHDTVLADRPVTWESSDPSVARVSADGRVVAGAPGIAAITATCEAQRAHVAIEVAPTRTKWTPVRTRRALMLGAAGVLALTAVVAILAWPETPPPEIAGTIQIPDNLPPGATITLQHPDGQTRQVTERLSTLEPGSYVLRFQATGFEPDSQAVTVRAGQMETWAPSLREIVQPPPPGPDTTKRIPRSAVGTVRIAGNLPPGAELTMRQPNGQTRSITPGTLSLQPGSYVFEFRAPGFELDRRTVEVRTSETQIWAPNVRAVAGPVNPPPPPATGTLRIGGNPPSGATLTATNESGRILTLVDPTTTLEPGSYVLEFRASGYEPDRQTLRVRAGETETWTPAVRALPPKPIDPPPARARADEAAIATAVREFVAAFKAKDARRVVPLLPPDQRDVWRQLLQSRNVSNFDASLVQSEPARIIGDEASVQFSIRVRFTNLNVPNDLTLHYVGSIQRIPDGFRMSSLRVARN